MGSVGEGGGKYLSEMFERLFLCFHQEFGGIAAPWYLPCSLWGLMLDLLSPPDVLGGETLRYGPTCAAGANLRWS